MVGEKGGGGVFGCLREDHALRSNGRLGGSCPLWCTYLVGFFFVAEQRKNGVILALPGCVYATLRYVTFCRGDDWDIAGSIYMPFNKVL